MRDDLRLLVDLVRLLWRRLTCPAHVLELLSMDDELWTVCWACAYQSPGVVIHTAYVRREWAFDRMRQRFGRRKAS